MLLQYRFVNLNQSFASGVLWLINFVEILRSSPCWTSNIRTGKQPSGRSFRKHSIVVLTTGNAISFQGICDSENRATSRDSAPASNSGLPARHERRVYLIYRRQVKQGIQTVVMNPNSGPGLFRGFADSTFKAGFSIFHKSSRKSPLTKAGLIARLHKRILSL